MDVHFINIYIYIYMRKKKKREKNRHKNPKQKRKNGEIKKTDKWKVTEKDTKKKKWKEEICSKNKNDNKWLFWSFLGKTILFPFSLEFSP